MLPEGRRPHATGGGIILITHLVAGRAVFHFHRKSF